MKQVPINVYQYTCICHIAYEGMIRLLPGEDESSQDIQLHFCMNMMSLEGHDVEAQSNLILKKADLGICFIQSDSPVVHGQSVSLLYLQRDSRVPTFCPCLKH